MAMSPPTPAATATTGPSVPNSTTAATDLTVSALISSTGGGLTKAGIYHHFESKEELLYYLHKRHIDCLLLPMLDAADRIADPEQRLRSFLGDYATLLTRDPSLRLLINETKRLSPPHVEEIRDAWRRGLHLVRDAVAEHLQRWRAATELQSLRHRLISLAYDADVVLDLHCDCEAVLHLYAEEACWSALEPLARRLGCQAVLLARNSGGLPFDECLSGLWWQLAQAVAASGAAHPIPQACASTTVELRGRPAPSGHFE